jgi:hypothetical protein
VAGIPVPEDDEAASDGEVAGAEEAGEDGAEDGGNGEAGETEPAADVAGPVSTA